MAVCGHCGVVGARVRSQWKGTMQLPDECPHCAPQSFEKFQMPSDKKIWMGYEAHPNEYVKSEDGGFDRKPEYRAEQEARLGGGDPDDAAAQERAVEKKRMERRTRAMDSGELLHALGKAREIANAL